MIAPPTMVSNIGVPLTIANKSVFGICKSAVSLFANSKYFETEIAEFENKIEKKIQKSVDFAEAGTWEPMDQLTKFVYSEIRI